MSRLLHSLDNPLTDGSEVDIVMRRPHFTLANIRSVQLLLKAI
jgi:hypothetical protein